MEKLGVIRVTSTRYQTEANPRPNFCPPPKYFHRSEEMYPPTVRAPLRWELLRSTPRPHAFPPGDEPLAKFGPTAIHPTHPGGGEIYYPTSRTPLRQEALRRTPHPHAFPPGEETPGQIGASVHPSHAPGGQQDLFPNWSGAQVTRVTEDPYPLTRFTP